MLIEKEIISPGVYWYVDEKTGLPRKLEVTPELTKYWHEQGSKMLSFGLPVPVPYEHDFDQHPMTPKDKLLNNAGEVKEYRLKNNALFGVVDVQDPEAQKKVGKSIRWTSPWINSFTDGDGRQWNNVITHLALTTRPRITKQAPFPSIAAALSLATEMPKDTPPEGGFCLSNAGKLVKNMKTGAVRPLYPIAFSLLSGGARFAEDDDTRPLKKKDKGSSSSGGDKKESSSDKKEGGSSSSSSGGPPSKSKTSSSSKPPTKDENPTPSQDEFGVGRDGGSDENGGDVDDIFTPDSESGGGGMGSPGSSPLNPLGDPSGDVRMEEILCDLLNALGVYMPENISESEFKRALYEAAMGKIRELTSKAQMMMDPTHPANMQGQMPPAKPPTPMGAGGTNQPNPLVQQEQPPMYMSLEEINKLPEPMRGVALAMHTENVKLRAEMDAAKKTTDSLRDAKLKEATAARDTRITLLGKMSPRAKADLETMKALPSMALSMGDGGQVVDPMDQTLTLLEKSVSDMPRLLITEASALSVQQQPTDGEMSQEAIDSLADSFARSMGAPPEQKKAS